MFRPGHFTSNVIFGIGTLEALVIPPISSSTQEVNQPELSAHTINQAPDEQAALPKAPDLTKSEMLNVWKEGLYANVSAGHVAFPPGWIYVQRTHNSTPLRDTYCSAELIKVQAQQGKPRLFLRELSPAGGLDRTMEFELEGYTKAGKVEVIAGTEQKSEKTRELQFLFTPNAGSKEWVRFRYVESTDHHLGIVTSLTLSDDVTLETLSECNLLNDFKKEIEHTFKTAFTDAVKVPERVNGVFNAVYKGGYEVAFKTSWNLRPLTTDNRVVAAFDNPQGDGFMEFAVSYFEAEQVKQLLGTDKELAPKLVDLYKEALRKAGGAFANFEESANGPISKEKDAPWQFDFYLPDNNRTVSSLYITLMTVDGAAILAMPRVSSTEGIDVLEVVNADVSVAKIVQSKLAEKK